MCWWKLRAMVVGLVEPWQMLIMPDPGHEWVFAPKERSILAMPGRAWLEIPSSSYASSYHDQVKVTSIDAFPQS